MRPALKDELDQHRAAATAVGREAGAELRDFAAKMLTAFLSKPDDLEVTAEQVGDRVAVTAKPHPADAGRATGARGATHVGA